jgi:hypothetical protein
MRRFMRRRAGMTTTAKIAGEAMTDAANGAISWTPVQLDALLEDADRLGKYEGTAAATLSDCARVIREFRAALTAEKVAGREPVAWQYRPIVNGKPYPWIECTNEAAERLRSPDYREHQEVRDLCVAPQQPAQSTDDARAAVDFYAANPSAALVDFQKRFATQQPAQSAEQDERAASPTDDEIIEDATEAFGRSREYSNCFGEPSERSLVHFVRKYMARAASTQYTATQPAQTALRDDVLMQAIADTAARGHVWASRVLSNFRAVTRQAAKSPDDA